MYLNTLHHQFVFDDFRVIVNNSFIKDWKYFPALFTGDYFRISGELSYRPLVTVSYFIDYALWHLNPFGFHLTNLFIHALNVFLVYSLLSQITKDRKLAGISSLFFGVHPLLTEAVNSVGFREDLLCAIFFLLSVFFYRMLYTSQHKIFCYSLALLSYLFSLLSKEMAISLPLIIFTTDLLFPPSKTGTVYPHATLPPSRGWKPGNLFIPSSRDRRGLGDGGAERLPVVPLKTCILRYYPGFLIMSGIYILLRLVFLKNPSEYVPYPGNSLVTNILTMAKVIASYIKQMFFPVVLNADYHVIRETSLISPSFLIAVTLLICVAAIFLRLSGRQKEITFSILWTFIMLIPVMNIMPIGNIMAERYLYIPLVGFCVFLGICIKKLHASYPLVSNLVARVCIAAILIFYFTCTVKRNRIWTDERTLWRHTVNNTSCSFNAHNNLGKEYFQQGLIDKAIGEYTIALSKASEVQYAYGTAHYNLGIAYDGKGMYDDAISEYKNALRGDPQNSDAHNNLGVAFFKNGKPDPAIEELNMAILLDPNNPVYHQNLAKIYDEINLPDKAKIEQEKAKRFLELLKQSQ